MRYVLLVVVAAAVAGCVGGDQSNGNAELQPVQSTQPVSEATTATATVTTTPFSPTRTRPPPQLEQTTIGGVAQPADADGRPQLRFAVADDDDLLMLNQSGDWVSVGPAGSPVWSPDGRYLAWSTLHEDGVVGPRAMNEPDSATIYVLDTLSGSRIRYRDDAQALSGWLLPTSRGFVAPLSGRNNLGNDATDFVVLRFDDLANGQSPGVTHSEFTLEYPTKDYDFDWTTSHGDDLYVVVTEASTLLYRYLPSLWRVTLTGKAELVIPVQQKGPNLGLDPLAVSPDGEHIVFSRGFRSGMCYYDVRPWMRRSDGGLTAVAGLPTMEADGLSVFTRSVEWLDDTSYLIAGHVAPVNCKDSALPTFNMLYQCTVTAGCNDTSIPAARHARSRLGPTAQAVADGPADEQGTLRIEWDGARFTRDEISIWRKFAWSR